MNDASAAAASTVTAGSIIFLTVGMILLRYPGEVRTLALRSYGPDRPVSAIVPGARLLETRFAIWLLRSLGLILVCCSLVLFLLVLR